MKYLVIGFAVWAGLSYPIYRFVAPWAVVAYGVVSLACLLIWAAGRKKPQA